MKTFAIKFQLWLPAVMRVCLMCIQAMIGAFAAAMVGKHSIDLADWGWLEWLLLIGGVLNSGLMVLIAFLDQTMTFIKNKFGETQFLERNG